MHLKKEINNCYRQESGKGIKIKLNDFIKVFSAGTACLSIKGLCEEYEEGLDQLQQESWYRRNKDRTVKRIAVIGGGMYKTELRIELQNYLNSAV